MGWLGKDSVESGPLLLLVYHHPALCTIPLQGTAGITGSTTNNNSGLFAPFDLYRSMKMPMPMLIGQNEHCSTEYLDGNSVHDTLILSPHFAFLDPREAMF